MAQTPRHPINLPKRNDSADTAIRLDTGFNLRPSIRSPIFIPVFSSMKLKSVVHVGVEPSGAYGFRGTLTAGNDIPNAVYAQAVSAPNIQFVRHSSNRPSSWQSQAFPSLSILRSGMFEQYAYRFTPPCSSIGSRERKRPSVGE